MQGRETAPSSNCRLSCPYSKWLLGPRAGRQQASPGTGLAVLGGHSYILQREEGKANCHVPFSSTSVGRTSAFAAWCIPCAKGLPQGFQTTFLSLAHARSPTHPPLWPTKGHGRDEAAASVKKALCALQLERSSALPRICSPN